MNNVADERPVENGRMLPRIGIDLGRDKLPWDQEICDRIDQAVHSECKRTKEAAKFLPMYGLASPGELTVPADTIMRDGAAMGVDKAATTPLIELLAKCMKRSPERSVNLNIRV